MGMFDTFAVNDCDGQVKIFYRNMDLFRIGDIVPSAFDDTEDYGIKLRNGGWIIVKNRVFFCYQEEQPQLHYLYDKWGRRWDNDNPPYP